ncbi:MAG: response regulator [Bacteriovoracaceae bacterium]
MNDLSLKILIVEDEPQLRKLLQLTLSNKGFKVIEAHDGREGESFVTMHRPDLVLLDIGLPDISGTEVLKRIRSWSQVPIIILSVVDDSEVIIGALNNGADDYVTKPFDSGELLARINVCLRRSQKKVHDNTIFEFGNIKVNFDSRIVTKLGAEVKLTSIEYDLLCLFIKNADKILTSRQILKEVWGPSSIDQAQYPRVYIRHLRQKLEDDPDRPRFFQTEAGVGYRLMTRPNG